MRLPSLLILSFFFLTSCATLTPKFKGSVFLHHRIPPEFCKDGLEYYGLYRKLANGDEEFLPYCSEFIVNYLAIHSYELDLVEESTE